MDFFINFDPLMGISVNSYAKPQGYANGDIQGFIDDILDGRPGHLALSVFEATQEQYRHTIEGELTINLIKNTILYFEQEH